ncbi:hypothetical protein [Pigmentiphaga litoralis]|uniref:Uncharacterized protein n=1 Tax=Pigmentiphaga litoralis TaxID=516702 RepID=A0A7Y9IX50_9BURK|nr:hypothetical protein [Pigmentiphaga litoralis]NYE21925.1 hypothetical protein [Pigmentiphaga litoralis]NYE84460.1 hypothetical protein [Pigmentiphaga litoralis]
MRRLAEADDGTSSTLAHDALREADELAAAASTLRKLVEHAPRPQSYDEPAVQGAAEYADGNSNGSAQD